MNAPSSAGIGFADLATNILAIVVAALLLVTALPPPVQPVGDGRVAVAPVVERTPLAGPAMIAHLAARRAGSGEVAIDLSDGITVVAPSGAVAVPPDDPAALERAIGTPSGPVRLDVFSNRHYAAVTAALSSAGRATTELSVPAALRDPAGRSWSAAFLDLAATAGDPAAFRSGLAALLSASDTRTDGDGPGGAGGAPATAPSGVLDRLAGRIAAGLAALALALSAAAIAITEARQIAGPRRR